MLALACWEAGRAVATRIWPHAEVRIAGWNVASPSADEVLQQMLGAAHAGYAAVRDRVPRAATVYYAVPAEARDDQPQVPVFMLLQPRLVGGWLTAPGPEADALLAAPPAGAFLVDLDSRLPLDWSRFGTLVARGERFSLWRAAGP